MKTLLKVTMVLILVSFIVNQESLNANEINRKALMFEIDDFIKLSSFDGGTFSYKTVSKNDIEHRYSLNIRSCFRKVDGDSETTNDTLDYSENFEDKDSDISISIGVYRLWHKKTNYDISPYIGLGPFIGYDYDYDEKKENDTQNVLYYERESKYSNYYGGIKGIIGVECFVHKSISLHAEYRTAAEYRYYISERTFEEEDSEQNVTTTKNEYDYNELNLRSNTILGISIFF